MNLNMIVVAVLLASVSLVPSMGLQCHKCGQAGRSLDCDDPVNKDNVEQCVGDSCMKFFGTVTVDGEALNNGRDFFHLLYLKCN